MNGGERNKGTGGDMRMTSKHLRNKELGHRGVPKTRKKMKKRRRGKLRWVLKIKYKKKRRIYLY